jgi:hypothetical protein
VKSKVFLLILCFFLSAFTLFAQKPPRAVQKYEELIEGQLKSAELELTGKFETAADTFTFRVPRDAYAVRISLSGAEADLDLLINPGSPVGSSVDALYFSEKEDYNETIFITRQDESPLESGIYYAEVVYQLDSLPVIDGRVSEKIGYSIQYEVISAEPELVLIPGQSSDLELLPEKGMFAAAEVDIPRGTKTFRIDVYNTTADIDIFVSMKSPAKSRDEALYIGESMLGKESLVIGGYSEEDPASGRYYITFLDQMARAHPKKLTVIVSLSAEAPEFLHELPPIPEPEDSFESALLSTVEVIAGSIRGSGCLVSKEGHVITNWHVVKAGSGNASERINIALSTSTYLPPEELFTAELVFKDEKMDLALLKITSNIYGRPLPYRYTFPYFRMGRPAKLRIGQPLGVIGYPEVGGTGSRTSVTFTSGIVSGYERVGDCSLIKTDALINSGNSGGAVIDAYHELLGFPTYIMDINSDRMGYIYPVSCLPPDWMALIERSNR